MHRACILLPALFILAAAPLLAAPDESLGFLRDSLRAGQEAAPASKPTDWRQVNEASLAVTAMIALYQGLLSSQDGPVCMFTPSCSQYVKLAIKRYGLLRGILMAADRLQRCNGWGAAYYGTDPVTGKLNDPLP